MFFQAVAFVPIYAGEVTSIYVKMLNSSPFYILK